MSKAYIVSTYSNVPLFVVNDYNDLKENITNHYNNFIGENGKGNCHSIEKSRNGYTVNIVNVDKNNSVHSSSKIYKITEVNSF